MYPRALCEFRIQRCGGRGVGGGGGALIELWLVCGWPPLKRAVSEAQASEAKLQQLQGAIQAELRAGGWGMASRIDKLVSSVSFPRNPRTHRICPVHTAMRRTACLLT